MEPLKILLITQARVGSTRFPKKVLNSLGDNTLLGLHLERIKKSTKVTNWVVATTLEEGVEEILKIAKKADIDVFQGDENDVLDRFYQAASPYDPDFIVRVTSDCPLIDPKIIDDVITLTIESNSDYGANILIEEFPDGQDVEVFTFHALEKAWKDAKLNSEREHVTPYIRNNSNLKGGNLFNVVHLSAPLNFNHIRMTVDEPIDLEGIENLIKNVGPEASWMEYTQYIIHHISEFKNQDIQRNEGYLKSLKTENKK